MTSSRSRRAQARVSVPDPLPSAGFARDSSGLPARPAGKKERPVATRREDEGRAAAPFRSLGSIAAEALLATCEPSPSGSPSGLLSRQAWEAALVELYREMPDRCLSDTERDRDFAHWVFAEAKTLAGRLERMLHAGMEPALSGHVCAVVAALRSDADWARRRLDGSLEG